MAKIGQKRGKEVNSALGIVQFSLSVSGYPVNFVSSVFFEILHFWGFFWHYNFLYHFLLEILHFCDSPNFSAIPDILRSLLILVFLFISRHSAFFLILETFQLSAFLCFFRHNNFFHHFLFGVLHFLFLYYRNFPTFYIFSSNYSIATFFWCHCSPWKDPGNP